MREICATPFGSRRYGNPLGLVRHHQFQHIQEACVLKISLVSDGSFTKAEIRAVAENWVQVEDDPDIIDTIVDESIEILVNVNFIIMP